MVCSLGSGRMAVMARLLAASSFSQNIPEELDHRKLISQYIHRELLEANEANLLDEEDMHVFDLKPMEDPLQLVCCNACNKPVKASQYAAHAELCRSLSSTEETVSEVEGGSGHKKPPRKERKKLLSTHVYQGTIARELERSESIEADDNVASKFHLDEQVGTTHSFSVEATRKEFPKGSIGTELNRDHVVGHHKPGHVLECCLPAKDVPVPLATKMYYSQRNHRLRSAVTLMYHEGWTKDYHSDLEVLQGNLMPPQASSPRNLSNEQIDNQPGKKRDFQSLPSVQTRDQILEPSSEAYLGKAGGCPPTKGLSNQFPVSSTTRPEVDPGGMLRSKNHTRTHPFARNSGNSIRTMQHPNGSVPVT